MQKVNEQIPRLKRHFGLRISYHLLPTLTVRSHVSFACFLSKDRSEGRENIVSKMAKDRIFLVALEKSTKFGFISVKCIYFCFFMGGGGGEISLELLLREQS